MQTDDKKHCQKAIESHKYFKVFHFVVYLSANNTKTHTKTRKQTERKIQSMIKHFDELQDFDHIHTVSEQSQSKT